MRCYRLPGVISTGADIHPLCLSIPFLIVGFIGACVFTYPIIATGVVRYLILFGKKSSPRPLVTAEPISECELVWPAGLSLRAAFQNRPVFHS